VHVRRVGDKQVGDCDVALASLMTHG
jgi:hypothetical protein